MRVLHFAPRVCWPLDTGAKLRNYHLARVISRDARVTLLAFSEDDRPLTDLAEIYEQVIAIRRSPGYTPAKILRGAVGRTPLSLLNYTTGAMKQALERALTGHDFDVVQMESIHLMAYLPLIHSARSRPLVICDWHNIESELMQRYSERERSFLRKTYAQKTVRQLRTLEQRATRDFDGHVVVSQRDRERLLKLNPAAAISVVENGVDTAYYADDQIEAAYASWRKGQPDGAGRNRLLFVGSMDYHANISAVIDFARSVWPGLQKAKPEFVFTIVGRDPAIQVRELMAIPGVEVSGTVDDVRPYYREALASVVPLKVGGGSRLKILESMAAGVPVVSTALGAEGLEVRDQEDILIADSDDELSSTIKSVVEQDDLRRRLIVAGRALISARYDWSRLGADLLAVYRELRP